VLSGLLRGDEPEVLAAYRAQGLALEARLPLGEWVTLVLGRGARCRRSPDGFVRRSRLPGKAPRRIALRRSRRRAIARP
jgi:hypothetical protein